MGGMTGSAVLRKSQGAPWFKDLVIIYLPPFFLDPPLKRPYDY
jgi:hypothetical protein